MPRFETTLTLTRSVEDVFEFFRRPAKLIQANPPELNLEVLEAPEVLQQGSRIVIQAWRFGISQRLESEVTILEANALIIDELRQGPFRKWVQTHRFAKAAPGTLVTFQIDYEPPGGLLGLMVNATAIDAELRSVFAYRKPKLQELLGPLPGQK
jgi:ligand-binding SRPBCC domain-containing protein